MPHAQKEGQLCSDERNAWEYQLIADTYANLVTRNLAAGGVWGPTASSKSPSAWPGAPVPLGSCSDWQLAIPQALWALPIHCWQLCKIRCVWYKAVVVYPKDAIWWRASGLVFDPWFLGAALVNAVFQWFLWAGIN